MSSAKHKTKRLVLLDAHAILHRAYHALPEFSSAAGEPTGALYGLSAMLIKLLADLRPDFIVACYDLPGPTFRHEAYEHYKAKRPKAEDDLIAQMKRSRDIFKAFNIPMYEKEGFEADDILGTIVEKMKKKLSSGELEIVIASGDMDTLQLVDGARVRVYTLKKGIQDTVLYDEKAVEERFGFGPKLLVDFKGLRGDPSDNILGIKGIGEKTATLLIQTFGNIEEIYQRIKKTPSDFIKKGFKERVVNLLREGEEEALFSKTLAQIRTDVPIEFLLPRRGWIDAVVLEEIEKLFRELSFRTLFERAKKLVSPEGKEVPPQPDSDSVKNAPPGAPLRRIADAGGDPRNADAQDAASPPMFFPEHGGGEGEAHFSQDEIRKIGIALWLVDSTLTNPTREDILQFGGTRSLDEAKDKIFKELKSRGLEKLYNDIELPLIPVLKEAESRGIIIDTRYLKSLSGEYHKKLAAIQKNIYKEAGSVFNINSPRQLSEILFEKLGLSTKGLRKTEGGARSTRESELTKLRGSHKIVDLILDYRELQKLLSTYVDNIPAMLDSKKRLHTTFVQTGTTTGRFSSINPNLQNIPARGERGKEIRRAFVAEAGHALVSFDYSQIELRVLAILSGDKDFINVFKGGKDIHTAVAAEVFGVGESDVTNEMRRRAKVINFGIIYGMGVTSLERALNTSRAEAQVFYDNYWSGFPGVADYIRQIKKEAASRGYTETLFGRARYFEGIHSHIPYIRSSAERMAINAPIQGTAADIIKIAMISVHKSLEKDGMLEEVHLLLQVHDELIYEIENKAIARAISKIEKIMEQAVQSPVPLSVSVSIGKTWGDMEEYKGEGTKT